jgi:hypothetical protein
MNKRHLYQQMKKLLTVISIGGFLAISSIALAQQAPDIAQQTPDIAQQAPEAADGSNRLEARLQPVIPVDASGQARLDNKVGTGNDRFTSEVIMLFGRNQSLTARSIVFKISNPSMRGNSTSSTSSS